MQDDVKKRIDLPYFPKLSSLVRQEIEYIQAAATTFAFSSVFNFITVSLSLSYKYSSYSYILYVGR